MAKIYQCEAARRDLVEHFVYLAENANLEIMALTTAERQKQFSERHYGYLDDYEILHSITDLS